MIERNDVRAVALARRRGLSSASAARLQFESLEERSLLSADPLADLVAQPAGRFLGSSGGTTLNTIVSGLTPAQVQQAYSATGLTFTSSTGTVAANGAGETIAIVDAYDDPNIAADLHTFDQKMGLADPTLTKIEQFVNGVAPAANASWDTEISLDVEWAHAMAPGAKILLVEANTSSLTNLLSSIQYAAAQPGVSVVSMSWGASEFSGETSYDSYFTTPAGHTPVAFVASAGDGGAAALWPAVSPNVLGVGGTSLNLTSSGTYASESAWSGSGGGQSVYESEPASQLGVQSSGKRETPDVAFDANPATGFAIYDSVSSGGQAGWIQVGGTSAGAPQWAGLIAIADQGLALKGQAAIGNAPAAIYGLSSTDFHDITTGSNGHAATAGYDMVTGRGTPIASAIVSGLVGPTSNTSQATVVATTHLTAYTTRLLASSTGAVVTLADPDVSGIALTLAASSTSAGTSSTGATVSMNSLSVGAAAAARSGATTAAMPGLFADAAFDLAPDGVEMLPTIGGLNSGTNLSATAAANLLGAGLGPSSLGETAIGGARGAAGAVGQSARSPASARGESNRRLAGDSAEREWLPVVDACFDESGWLADEGGQAVASLHEHAADVALVAAAVALASCWQVSKPAAGERDFISLRPRRRAAEPQDR